MNAVAPSDPVRSPPVSPVRPAAAPATPGVRGLLLALGLTGTLAAGLWSARWYAGHAERHLCHYLLEQARAIAQTLDPEVLERLAFTPADGQEPAYIRLAAQMRAYAQEAGLRCIFTVGQRDGDLVFGPESPLPGDPLASPPGTPYREPTPEIQAIFTNAAPCTAGPYKDEYGTFVTAYAPVVDPVHRRVRLVVGVDLEASAYQAALRRAWWRPLTLALAVDALLLLGWLALRHQQQRRGEPRGVWGHAESALAGGLGLVLTLGAASLAQAVEDESRDAQFSQLARAQIQSVGTALRSLRDQRLPGLAGLFHVNDQVTRAEFRACSTPLAYSADVLAWAWAPAVPAADRARFEGEARRSGFPDFACRERDAAGQLVPATDRDCLYPLWFIEPDQGMAGTLGYDLASDPASRTALATAVRTGLSTVTEPVRLSPDPAHPPYRLVLCPVFARAPAAPEGSSPRDTPACVGVAAAALHFESLLQQVSGQSDAEASSLEAGLYDLGASPGPRLLASTAAEDRHWSAAKGNRRPAGAREACTIMPLFAFGQTYAIVVQPGPAFLAAHPRRAGLWVGLGGALLTLALTGWVGQLGRHRSRLEAQVAGRTRELRESEQRWQYALEGAGDGVWDWDVPSARVRYSRQWKAMLGYAEAEIGDTLQDWRALVHPEDLKPVEAALQAHLRGETPAYSSEHRLRCNDGTWKWILDRGQVICRAPDGTPLRAIGTHADITARKTAEQALTHKTALLSGLLNSIPDLVFIKDHTGLYLGCNPAFCEFVGRPQEAIVGRTDFDLFPESVAKAFRENDRLMLAQRQPRHNEEWVDYPDGRRQLLDTLKAPLYLADGTALGVLGVSRDITARQHAEMHLRMLSRAVEQSPASIVITDLRGRIEYVNPKFTAVTGYTLDEVRGRNPRLLKSGNKPPHEYATLWATLREGREWCGEFENRKKNGESFWELASISPIADTAGRITHYVAVKEDITARKQAEAALQQTNRRLEAATAKANELAVQAELASSSKSQFLANMSHEIRTPMNGILGMTGLLLDTELTADQRQYATLVRNSGQALLTVINDILDFSKIEAGRLELQTRDFDLRALLEDTTDLLAVRAAEKGLPLVSLVDPQVPLQLRGDPDRVRQILLNLGGNAIKFTARGDVVCRVSVDRADAEHVTLRFAVTDTGIGIPAERQPDLFKPFSQVDGSTTRKYGGTGLGLAISRQLATLMGGQAGCLSEAGQGSTFWFTATFARQTEPAPEDVPLDLPDPPPRVLVADPHAATRESLRQPLRAWGFTVEVVADGPKALSRLREAAAAGAPYLIAFLEADLECAQGRPLLLALAEDPACERLHRVRLTTFGRRTSTTAAAGRDLHALTKPIHHTDLQNTVRRLLHPAAPEALRPHAAPAADPAPTPAPAPARTRLTLLLAEDNTTNQRVAVGILKKLGCQVDVAANGREALTALRTQPYDLVLMDCQMPEMDGFETTRQIRRPDSDVPNPSIPIIAMTAHAMDGDRQKCLAAGMDDYLTKPIDPALLAATLDRWAEQLLSPAEPAPPPRGTATNPALRTPNPQPPTQIFDRTGFLRRVMGDTELARSLAGGFLAELPELVRRFQAAVDSRDLTSALQQAHRLKGSSANMGGLALHTVAAAAETAAKGGQLQSLIHLAPELAREAERLHSTLHGVWPDAAVH